MSTDTPPDDMRFARYDTPSQYTVGEQFTASAPRRPFGTANDNDMLRGSITRVRNRRKLWSLATAGRHGRMEPGGERELGDFGGGAYG